MALTVTDNACLRAFNTFGLSERAARLIEITRPQDLAQALALSARAPSRLVLGGGSNVLFTRTFEGTILLIRTRGMRALSRSPQGTLVEAEAGEPWDAFVRWTLGQRLGGLENLALIPGSVGASPIQNIGAYGLEMRERFHSLDALDMDTGIERSFEAHACAFGYRDSVFKRPQGRHWLVTRVRFLLPEPWAPRLDYGAIREEIAAVGGPLTPTAVADAVSAIRRRRLPDPAVLGNAGSFFKNPIVTAGQASALQAQHPELPCWPQDEGGADVKLSAAWMIERCGWKGQRLGDAGVHAQHALVLVNHGQATGAALLALARQIQHSVLERFGVAIEPEPTIL